MPRKTTIRVSISCVNPEAMQAHEDGVPTNKEELWFLNSETSKVIVLDGRVTYDVFMQAAKEAAHKVHAGFCKEWNRMVKRQGTGIPSRPQDLRGYTRRRPKAKVTPDA